MLKCMLAAISKKYWKILLSILIISSMGCTLLFGLSSGYNSLKNSFDNYLAEYHYPDATIILNQFSNKDYDLDVIDGVNDVCYRLAINAMMKTQNQAYYSSRLYSYSDNDFQKFYIWDKSKNNTPYEDVLVEYKFAKNKGIHAGDIVEFKLNNQYEKFFVSELVSLPEAIAIEAFEGMAEIESDFGYFYFNKNLIKERFPSLVNYYNEIQLDLRANANSDKVLKEVEELIGKDTIKKSYTYDDSAVKEKIYIKPLETISIFLPIVFFITTIIVVFLFMSLMINQCRREIGILRALGFSKRKIWSIFSSINLIIAIFEVILGTIMGFFLMKYMLNIYLERFAIPKTIYTYAINIKIYIISILLTFAVGQISTLLCIFNIARVEPIEAMTRENVTDVKVPKFIYKLVKPLTPLTKYTVISEVKNKFKFILSTICISFSVMLIVASFAVITSKNYILKETFETRTNYDSQVFFNSTPNSELLEEIENLDNVERIEKVKIYHLKIEKGGKSENAVINAISGDSRCVNIFNTKNKQIYVQKDGIILEKNVADKLNASIGDTVNVDGKEFKVTEISSQCLNKTSYISLDSSDKIGNGIIDTIYVNIQDGTEQELIKFLSEKEEYVYSVFVKTIHDKYIRSFKSYDIAAWINIIFAILIGSFIVFNTVITNILNNLKKLCIIRVLGFQFSEISKKCFVQILIEFFIAGFIGILTGSVIAKKLLRSVCTVRMEYKYVNGFKEYFISMVIVFLFLVISHILAMRMFKKWNIEETIKEKE